MRHWVTSCCVVFFLSGMSGCDVSHLFPQTHTLSSCTFHQNTPQNHEYLHQYMQCYVFSVTQGNCASDEDIYSHCSLLSLSPQYQHPPSFTNNWPTMKGLLFFHLFLLLFFSSSSFCLSPHPPLTLFTATLERKEVCETSFPFFSLSPLVFLLFLFLVSQRGEPGAP